MVGDPILGGHMATRADYLTRARWAIRTDGSPIGILLVAHGDACLCVAARLDASGAPWLAGSDLLPLDAFEATDEDLADMVAREPATAECMATFGLLDGTLWPMGLAVESLAGAVPGMDAVLRGSRSSDGSLGSFPVTQADAEGALAMGYAMARSDAGLLPMGPRPPSDDARAEVTPATGSVPRDVAMNDVARWCDQGRRIMAESIGFEAGAMWSPRLQAHLGIQGRTGEYRRQAAGLFPILAPMLAHDPTLSDLVDAGRPFAMQACSALDRWLAPRRGGGFTVAKLRRLCGVPIPGSVSKLVETLRLLSDLPSQTLDAMTHSGTWPSRAAGMAWRWAEAHGLDASVLMGIPDDLGTEGMEATLFGASDMGARFADTLLTALIDEGREPALAAGMAILFGGVGLGAVRTRVNRWHSRIDAFDRSLPHGRDMVTWPALFDPYERDGRRLICLTSPSELRAEGADGPDGNGMQGLAHCVGGYGLACYAGASHVVSVRAMHEGGWHRIATIDFEYLPGRGLLVRQMCGYGNRPPSFRAQGALADLCDGIVTGRVRIAREALERRDPSGFDDGVDRSDRANLAATLEAWRPFLPKTMAGIGLDALAAKVRDHASSAGAPNPQALSMRERWPGSGPKVGGRRDVRDLDVIRIQSLAPWRAG